MSDTTIYLARHGETVWNTAGRFQGKLDSALTARGLEQAERTGLLLGRLLDGYSRELDCRVSPLGRAKATADIVSRHVGRIFQEEPRLQEVSIGAWDGMTHYEIDHEYPGLLDGANAFAWFFRSPDGESLDAACERARDWLASVGPTTVAISHGLTGRLIRGIYLGLSSRQMLELPMPQDGVFRLKGGTVEFLGSGF